MPMPRVMFVVLASLLAVLGQGAQAQSPAEYPAKVIRVIVPVAAGGNQEITIRAIAEEMSKGLGQQIIIESRPGASALVGTQMVARAAPDGYTLLSVSSTFVRASIMVANAGYDPVRDFAAISLVSRTPMVLVVSPSLPVRSVTELVALAKEKPGQLSYATAGIGSTGHVAAEMFSRMAGIRMLHVPYKGNAQAIVDVLGGQVPVMFDQVSTSVSHVRAGKLRALGVTTRVRSPLFPEVPTIDEAGLPGFEDFTWNGLLAPTGTPREVVERLRAEAARAVSLPELRVRFLERGIELLGSASPDEFATYIRSEFAGFSRLARDANLKAE
jgi:tripartite-type tricarboxylate transporter receptor subunit TctC